MKSDHGTGIRYYEEFTMSPVELQARIKEQTDLKRLTKLKYRGVEYTLPKTYGTPNQ